MVLLTMGYPAKEIKPRRKLGVDVVVHDEGYARAPGTPPVHEGPKREGEDYPQEPRKGKDYPPLDHC